MQPDLVRSARFREASHERDASETVAELRTGYAASFMEELAIDAAGSAQVKLWIG
jgi:hypothetical protein